MDKIDRDFSLRDELERNFITEDTWCEACQKADLGMLHPVEFEENGEVIVKGVCNRCGGRIRTTIIVQEREEI